MRPPVDIEFARKAAVGTASPVLGVITAFQEQIGWHLRIASLLVGLAVGVLSLIGLWRRNCGGGGEIAFRATLRKEQANTNSIKGCRPPAENPNTREWAGVSSNDPNRTS